MKKKVRRAMMASQLMPESARRYFAMFIRLLAIVQRSWYNAPYVYGTMNYLVFLMSVPNRWR